MKKSLIIVGNGPLARDLSREIDAADYVLRFNNSSNISALSGSKTDLLMLATSAKQTQQWLNDPRFLNSHPVRNATEILFPVHPSIVRRFHHRPNLLSRLRGRRADWTQEVFVILSATGKAFRVMKPDCYFEVCAELGIPQEKMKELFPRQDFLASGTYCGITHRANGISEFVGSDSKVGNAMTGLPSVVGFRTKLVYAKSRFYSDFCVR